jgi:hypothetical protein
MPTRGKEEASIAITTQRHYNYQQATILQMFRTIPTSQPDISTQLTSHIEKSMEIP